MKKLVFRPATEEDFLGSLSTRRMLERLQDREVDLKLILGNMSSVEYDQWVLTDDKNNLSELQRKDSIEHFSSTRFGDIVCSTNMLILTFQSCNPSCRKQCGTLTELETSVKCVCIFTLSLMYH